MHVYECVCTCMSLRVCICMSVHVLQCTYSDQKTHETQFCPFTTWLWRPDSDCQALRPAPRDDFSI